MTDRPDRPGTRWPDGPADGPNDRPAEAASLVTDWTTIWQSELSAAATDPERLAAWNRLLALWAAGAGVAARMLSPPPAGSTAHEPASGRAGPEPPAGSAPAAAASDARDAALDRLARRVEELERRLAGLDTPGTG